jgi:hypothetical protein
MKVPSPFVKKNPLCQRPCTGLTRLLLVSFAKYLLSQKKGLFILSERFNQDPLEAFFGQQRLRGGRSDNPNVQRFLENAQAIRIQRSLAIGSCSNLQKRQREPLDMEELSKPLQKHPRKLPVPIHPES